MARRTTEWSWTPGSCQPSRRNATARDRRSQVEGYVHFRKAVTALEAIARPSRCAFGVATDPEQVERFVNEARFSARIKSDHAVQVVGAGRDSTTGLVWLAIELLEGESLGA